MLQSFHLVILGSDTPVGRALTEQTKAQDVSLHAISFKDWDLTDTASTLKKVKALEASFVINCVMASPFGTTAKMAKVLAQVCSELEVGLLQLSNNKVFMGQDGELFKEDDQPYPQSQAGQDVLAVEEAVATCPKHLILRSGWVFSSQGEDDVARLLSLAQQHVHLNLSDNKQLSPTSACDIAAVLLAMVQQAQFAELWGTYQYCSSEPTTLFKFAEVVVAEARQHQDLQVAEINSDASHEMNAIFPESSPKLACKKLLFTFGIKAKPWRPALSRIIKTRYTAA
jgi:dTDP-4-dehydrorhamnose reductase